MKPLYLGIISGVCVLTVAFVTYQTLKPDVNEGERNKYIEYDNVSDNDDNDDDEYNEEHTAELLRQYEEEQKKNKSQRKNKTAKKRQSDEDDNLSFKIDDEKLDIEIDEEL
jgi:hypothetical protein